MITRLEPQQIITPLFMPMFIIATINRTRKGSLAYFNPPFLGQKTSQKTPSAVDRALPPACCACRPAPSGAQRPQYTFPGSGPKPAPIGGIKQDGVR
jgi:hypothetical protein